MPTGMDIWVMAPGAAHNADDGAWTVHIADATGAPYDWAGTGSTASAPRAHSPVLVPPGIYVVHAVGQMASQRTDRAIVVVESGGMTQVLLWVDGTHEGTPEPGSCHLEVRRVRARGDVIVEAIEVTGTVRGCDEVTVSVAQGDSTRKARAKVDGPTFTAGMKVKELAIECGTEVEIVVSCADDECSVTESVVLDCEGR